MPKPRLFLLDGAAVAYRGHFAFIKNPRVTSKGFDTSAVYGFMDTLLMILRKQKPDLFAVVFDSREPTFRHKLYKEYKANREEMPEDLSKSWPYLEQMVKAMNIPILVKPGYEADDLIGTMVQRATKEKIESVIVSGDKDFMQLIGPGVKMYKPKWPDDWTMADEKDVLEKFGVKPEQVIDVLSLMGDSSDNVPGVPGIGEKTATTLIQEYGSLDNLFKNVEKNPKAQIKGIPSEEQGDGRLVQRTGDHRLRGAHPRQARGHGLRQARTEKAPGALPGIGIQPDDVPD